MALLTITEASHQLGVSVHTLKHRLKRGEIEGQQQTTPQGFVWLIEVPDEAPKADVGTPDGSDDVPVDVACGTSADIPNATLRELHRMEEFIESLKDEVSTLRSQLETKDRQIGELHVLLQQAQAALPPPRDNRPWWRRVWPRD
jgi:hypothetical protein